MISGGYAEHEYLYHWHDIPQEWKRKTSFGDTGNISTVLHLVHGRVRVSFGHAAPCSISCVSHLYFIPIYVQTTG